MGLLGELGQGSGGAQLSTEAGIPRHLAQQRSHMLAARPRGVQLIRWLLREVTVQLLAHSTAL